jgi:hypothetical protein
MGPMSARSELLSLFFNFPAAWLLGSLAACHLPRLLCRARGTTLLEPLGWSIAALAMLVVSATGGPPGEPADRYLGYTAALFTLAPGLAVLGAKRPQHTAWQFIVLSFVGIFLLPALNGLASGLSEPQPHALVRWLYVAVLFVGIGNYLPTGQWPAALLAGSGAVFMIGPWLPLGPERTGASDVWVLLVLNIALVAQWVSANRRRKAQRGSRRLWLDFRDAYGVVWGLRVAERLNVAARRHGWPVQFTWQGIETIEPIRLDARRAGPAVAREADIRADDRASEIADSLERLDPELRRRIRREFHALLRRFVSRDWIAARDDVEPATAGGEAAGSGVSRGGKHNDG